MSVGVKTKLKIKPIYECRCSNGRLHTKTFTRLAHTGFTGLPNLEDFFFFVDLRPHHTRRKTRDNGALLSIESTHTDLSCKYRVLLQSSVTVEDAEHK